MRKNKNFKHISLDLSLIEVVYGVVFAYGFNFFDDLTNPSAYFRFFFAYLILVLDWIYSHHAYQEYKYTKQALVLDMGVLFVFSRLLNSSAFNGLTYLIWLSAIFFLYMIWDLISKKDKVHTGYDWNYCIAGDALAALAYFMIWFGATKEQFSVNDGLVNITVAGVYCITLFTWFKKEQITTSKLAENETEV